MESNKFGVSRKVLLAAIISLFAFMILLFILHIYARYLLRRQERRRRASIYRGTRQVAPDVMRPIEALETGLHPLVIASLPKFIYKPAEFDHGEVIECPICLSTIGEEATVRLLPNCKHVFHVECIDMWLSSNITCPICRTVAEPRVQPERCDLGTGVQPTAPPLEDSTSHGAAELEKAGGSGSRLNSFRRMLSRDRSSSRIHSRGYEVGAEDLERQ